MAASVLGEYQFDIHLLDLKMYSLPILLGVNTNHIVALLLLM